MINFDIWDLDRKISSILFFQVLLIFSPNKEKKRKEKKRKKERKKERKRKPQSFIK